MDIRYKNKYYIIYKLFFLARILLLSGVVKKVCVLFVMLDFAGWLFIGRQWLNYMIYLS